MAKSKLETCMLCDHAPCECNARKPKSRAAKGTARAMADRAPKATAPARPQDNRGDIPTSTPTYPSDSHLVNVTRPEGILLEEAALRALRPLMSTESLQDYRVVLTGVPSDSERLIIWRAQHRGSN